MSRPGPTLLRIAAAVVIFAGVFVLGTFAAQRGVQRPPGACTAAQPVASAATAALASAQEYLARGDDAFDQGDCERAIAAYSRAIELKPVFADAYNNRAYAYMAQRDYARALADLDKAIQIRPEYVNALMNRGDIHNYYYQIDYDRAVADYDRVLALDAQAAGHTSVCGHRMLAIHHGWGPGVLVDMLTGGVRAGCPATSPGY